MLTSAASFVAASWLRPARGGLSRAAPGERRAATRRALAERLKIGFPYQPAPDERPRYNVHRPARVLLVKTSESLYEPLVPRVEFDRTTREEKPGDAASDDEREQYDETDDQHLMFHATTPR